jgi:serine/threonine protein kinase
VVGKYVVQRKLAEGGMAEIFLATAQGAQGFEKAVVIKRVRSGLASDASFVEMFIAEARLASRMSHPNLVHIFDFDRHEDTYYLAMEYIRGRSLLDAHKRARELSTPIPSVLVAQIGVEIARGLGYAHRLTDHGRPLNLVHRDVTPHNVMLSYDGAVKLTDFGIAKAGGRATTAGMLKGKFAYMAPEQARGDPVDARTDIFALGITLWELLTGGRLFDGDTDLAVLRAVQERAVLPPADLNPEVDAELSDVIMKALARTPANRFQSAAELERALVQHVLHHSQGPDDTDVGAFVRDLFPVESERAEAPVAAQPGTGRAWRDEFAATQQRPVAQAARDRSEPPPSMPPDLLAPDASSGNSRTVLFDSSRPGRPDKQSSHWTPTSPARPEAAADDDGPTQRRQSPREEAPAGPSLADRLHALEGAVRARVARLTGTSPSRPVLAVGAVALLSTLVAIVLAIVLSRPAAPPPPRVTPSADAVPPKAAEPALARPLLPLAPAARETAPAPVAAAPAEPVLKQGEGILEVTLTPGGTVTIDGKDATPIEGTQQFPLRAGMHEVTVTNSRVIVSWSVYVRAGATVKKQYTFRGRR